MHPTTEKTLRIALPILLVLFGGATVLLFWGSDYHLPVLINEDRIQSIMSQCPNAHSVCRGVKMLAPSIVYIISQLAPYTSYFVLSLIIYGIWTFVSYMKRGEWKLQMTMKPWKITLLFLAAIWLVFTTRSMGNNDGQPYRMIFLPTEQVYPNSDSATTALLLKDYRDLESRGCLRPASGFPDEVGAAYVSHGCVQMSFVKRVLSQFLVLLAYLFVMLCLGKALLKLLKVQAVSLRQEALFSAGLGACGIIVFLWVFAILGLLTPLAGALILLGTIAACFREAREWIKIFLYHEWEVELPILSGTAFLFWFLLSYLAFNFLTVIRPFPIGWDDLGVYQNDPRLLVSYAAAIPRVSAFQWEYITALGYLLFGGYGSWFAATNGMMINWMAGLLAVLAVYGFSSKYLGRLGGILTALLYYTMPMVGHFSFADMKIDNAVFTMGVLATYALFQGLFPSEEDQGEHHRVYRWLILSGIFVGFAFSMKATSVMVIMALFTLIIGATLSPWAYPAALALGWAFFTYQGTFNVRAVSERVYGDPTVLTKTMVLVPMLIIAAVFGVVAYRKARSRIQVSFKSAGIFLAACVLCITPWLARNNILHGSVIPSLALTAPNPYTPTFILNPENAPVDARNPRALPKEIAVDTTTLTCTTSTSKKEELDRYWGYGSGWGHYLTLPWRAVMNYDSFGYYVTVMPALLLLPLLLLLPTFWKPKGRWLRWLAASTLFIVVQWAFFANGVPWYGIGMFLGLTVSIAALFVYAPDVWSQSIVGVLIALSLLGNIAQRAWQAETQQNLLAYPMGVISAEAMQQRTIPNYAAVSDSVISRATAMPERPYTYRIGTFIPYFIPHNLEILPVADHQLDFFSCLNQEHDAKLTLKRLQALGFNGIIFDTNTHTIEKDPNGTLHKKVQEFLDFVNTPGLGLQLPVNDPGGGMAYILLP